MFLTDATKEAMLNAAFPTGTGTNRCYLSAHTAYSATGASLHGSKTAGEWAAASGGAKDITATDVDITITAPATISWIGAWGGSSGDTFIGMMPNGATAPKSFQLDTTANERIYCEGHGWSNGQKVTFYGAAAPTGLTVGQTYFVVGVTAGDPDYFQVSETLGGSAVNITGEAAQGCMVSSIVEETYSSNGTHRVTSYVITL